MYFLPAFLSVSPGHYRSHYHGKVTFRTCLPLLVGIATEDLLLPDRNLPNGRKIPRHEEGLLLYLFFFSLPN